MLVRTVSFVAAVTLSSFSSDHVSAAGVASGTGPLYNKCGSVLRPGPNWGGQFNLKLKEMSGQGKQLCFTPGRYDGQVFLNGIHKLNIVAPQGGAVFVSNKPIKTTAPANFEQEDASFNIRDSSDLTFTGISISNNARYPDRVTHKVSRALVIQNSQNIEFQSTNVSSSGKSTVVVETSSVKFLNSRFECYYFCIAGSGNKTAKASVHAIDSECVINHKQEAHDIHPAAWTG